MKLSQKMKKKHDIGAYLFLIPAATFMLAFYGFSIVKSVQLSFQEYRLKSFFDGISPYIGFKNYFDIIESPFFISALKNTIIFTVGSIFFQFIIGLGLAVLFRKEFPASRILQGFLLAPWLISLMAVGAVWKWILDIDAGILNQFLQFFNLSQESIGWLVDTKYAMPAIILVNVWIGIPFNSVILLSGIKEIPEELFEAASIDGANGIQNFRFLIWPLLRPVVAVVLMLGVVYTLKVLDIILVTTDGGPAEATHTIATRAYQYSFVDFNFGKGAAMNNILILFSLTFAFVYLKIVKRNTHE